MHGQIRCIPISEDGGLHILEKRFLVYCWRVRKQRLFELFNQFQNKLPFSQWKKHSKNHIFFFLISWSNLISDEHLCWRPVNQASPVSSLNAMFTGLVTSCKELMITLHEPSTSLACYLQTGDNLAATERMLFTRTFNRLIWNWRIILMLLWELEGQGHSRGINTFMEWDLAAAITISWHFQCNGGFSTHW